MRTVGKANVSCSMALCACVGFMKDKKMPQLNEEGLHGLERFRIASHGLMTKPTVPIQAAHTTHSRSLELEEGKAARQAGRLAEHRRNY